MPESYLEYVKIFIESFEKASFWRLFKAISERFDSYLMVFQTSLYS